MKRVMYLLALSAIFSAPLVADSNEIKKQDIYDKCAHKVGKQLSKETEAKVIFGRYEQTKQPILLVDTPSTHIEFPGESMESIIVALENLIRGTSVSGEQSLVRKKCGLDPSNNSSR